MVPSSVRCVVARSWFNPLDCPALEVLPDHPARVPLSLWKTNTWARLSLLPPYEEIQPGGLVISKHTREQGRFLPPAKGKRPLVMGRGLGRHSAWPLTSSRLSFLLPLQCDDVFSGLPPPQVVPGELKPSQQQDLTAFLRLVGCSMQSRCPGPEDAVSNQKLFSTAYFLVSALAGMEKGRRTVVALRPLG